jgi:hypothetical protein
MSDLRLTTMMCGAALVAALVAWATVPRTQTPEAFADRGELFFPEFTDPNAAVSLEAVEFGERDGALRAFKVQNRAGRWIVPSQFDYPADAKDRLSQVAAAVTALRRDDFVTDLAADHERLGVVDPLDLAASGVAGRGIRLSIRGQNERLLADIIIGSQAKERQGYRYVRLPDQKRVYLSSVGALEISTEFEDWIERDVLLVNRDDIDEIVVRNYAVDERTDSVDVRETVFLRRRRDGTWTLDGLRAGETLSQGVVNRLLMRLVGLRIVGVLPKPAGITATLNRTAKDGRVSPEDVRDLARKGFYLAPQGQLLSNEGEVVVHTTSGIFYTLRFGQVAPGGLERSDAKEPSIPAAAATSAAPRENRYLFIMAAYDPSTATAPAGERAGTEQRIRLLHGRFAPWYYIISAEDFSTLRPGRGDLLEK